MKVIPLLRRVVLAAVLLLATAACTPSPVPTDEAASGTSTSESPFISIEEPGQGAVLAVQDAILVRGRGGGLFENALVVQALDSGGAVLAEQRTNADSMTPGGEGAWQVEMVIPAPPGTRGLIFAFATSPRDGSILTSASTAVTYGAAPRGTSEIRIEQPRNGSVVAMQAPLTVLGTGRGLFENTLVVQVLDRGGRVLLQEPTIMTSTDVGGPGTWSLQLELPPQPGPVLTIRAFATSPKDGSLDASDAVLVTVGTPP